MTDYQAGLLNIIFTMGTIVVIVGCNAAVLFLGLMIWQLLRDILKF